MLFITFFSLLIVIIGGHEVGTSCKYMDEQTWTNVKPFSSCGIDVNTIRKEQCNGMTRYICCKGEGKVFNSFDSNL